MIGRTLGQYRVDARLGAGGMGVVYRAYDTRLQRTVALKVVHRGLAIVVEREHVLEEARAASSLNHPNICTVYEVADVDGEAFIAMEYVAGRPLSQLIPEGGLPYEDVLRYAIGIADALAHAHERGVVHRDLKSANIVVGPEGRAKVLDFGIARRVETSSAADTSSGRHDPLGAIPGTTAYIAPEVLLGEPADPRSDIWALGVLMFEMAAGQMPFTGRNQFDLTSAILRVAPAPLPAHVPVPLRGIIVRCLAKDPVQRYQRAGEVRAALEAIQSSTGVTLQVPGRRRHLARPAALAAALALVVALVVWRPWPSRPALSERLAQGGRLSQVLASGRPTTDPSLSSDGKMVTFASEDETGQMDVYVARVGGGGRIRLTADPHVEAGPRFSHDGDRIAFHVRPRDRAVPEVRILPVLGGDATTVIQNAYSPAWSQDGRLLYLRQPPGTPLELTIASADGSGARVIMRGDTALPTLRNASWSPDGREIAVVRGSGGVSGEIWLVPVAENATPRKLSTDPAAFFSDWPSYTPDGRDIVHASNRGGATNIWLQPRDGGAPIQLTTGPGADEAPSIAADGTIAFLNARWKNVLEVYPLPAAASPKVLASHMPYLWAPALSPDGREVAYSQAEVDGSWHVWTVPVDGGTPRRLTSGAAGQLYPRYTPDGSQILFHTWSAPRQIGRVERTGGTPQMLSFGANTSDAFADVSPDGRQIVLTRTEADAERLYVAPASGGDARLLTRTPGAVARWSPDGAQIAFGATRRSAGIFVIGADGRGERRLTQDGGWPVWWPGRGIAYLAIGTDGYQEVRIVNPAGGTPVRLETLEFAGSNYPIDISRTGASLATSNGVYVSAEIWLLEPRK